MSRGCVGSLPTLPPLSFFFLPQLDHLSAQSHPYFFFSKQSTPTHFRRTLVHKPTARLANVYFNFGFVREHCPLSRGHHFPIQLSFFPPPHFHLFI